MITTTPRLNLPRFRPNRRMSMPLLRPFPQVTTTTAAAITTRLFPIIRTVWQVYWTQARLPGRSARASCLTVSSSMGPNTLQNSRV